MSYHQTHQPGALGCYDVPDDQMPAAYVVGVDLAQSSDYTGIAVLVQDYRSDVWAVRHLERFRDRAYTDVARHVRTLVAVLRSPRLTPDVRVVIDGTGIGAAVLDVMREADIDAPLTSIVIHGGDRVSSGNGVVRVPKGDLISVVAVALQQDRLKIAPDMTLAPTLTEELGKFRRKHTRFGNETFAAWREADHDDLVLAVSLSLWYAQWQSSPGFEAIPDDILAQLNAFGIG